MADREQGKREARSAALLALQSRCMMGGCSVEAVASKIGVSKGRVVQEKQSRVAEGILGLGQHA